MNNVFVYNSPSIIQRVMKIAVTEEYVIRASEKQ